jgi:eukaryotic-like serine/threonine-protein kinase
LEIWLGPSAGSSTIFLPAPRINVYWKWASAALAILLVAAVIGYRLKGPPKPKVAQAPVSVLVADFTNHTGDPIFDNTLEPMFNVALEGASFVNAFSRGTARKLAAKLPQPTDKLEEQPARLIATSQGLGAVVTGSLSRRGDGYKLSVEALDARTGNSIATAEVTASNKDELLLAVPKLAAPIRKALGDTTPESAQLAATHGPFTAASLEVVHDYGVAVEQQFAGKMQDSLQSFSKAAELDPNFARAYIGMAAVSGNLGQVQDAEKYVKLAMEHVDRMTDRERYRTRGLYYSTTENWQKCVEEYSDLVKQYPADAMGHNNLARCYKHLRNMPKAVEELRRTVEILPNSLTHTNLSLYASYAGDFPTAEREARTVLQLNPSYETAYVALAYAQVAQGQLNKAAETYHQVEKISKSGASWAALGFADIALYEGRLSDAARLFEEAAATEMAVKIPDFAGASLAGLAYVQLSRGQNVLASATVRKSLADSKGVKLKFIAGRIYVATGEAARARELATGLASEPQSESQAYAKLIEAEAALRNKNPGQAIKLFTEANGLADTWIGRFDLGRAYLETGLNVEADSEFDRCIQRRGETLDLLDYVPTYGYLPEVYYYRGRAREGLKSPGAADSYRTYLSIRGKAGEDPLLPEVRRRLGQ